MDWANLPGTWPLDHPSKDDLVPVARTIELLEKQYPEFFAGDETRVAGHPLVRDFLRRAWSTSDFREREWYLFQSRDHYNNMRRRSVMSQEERDRDDAQQVSVGAAR
jgi:hypothetical protein